MIIVDYHRQNYQMAYGPFMTFPVFDDIIRLSLVEGSVWIVPGTIPSE